MRTIKVCFSDWWEIFNINNNRIYNILTEHYDLNMTEPKNADYVFCSAFGNDYLKSDGIRIFYTAEAVSPDFNRFDYFIGFDEAVLGDRCLRIPNFIMNMKYSDEIKHISERHITADALNRDFCCWVCSNANGDPTRDQIFDALTAYRKVDSAGRYRNNTGNTERLADKLSFCSGHKFTLAVENTSYSGYTTEKIIDAFAADTIPVYWGDPDIGRYFNTASFINLMDYPSVEDGIKAVIDLDKDDRAYMAMLGQKAFLADDYVENSVKSLDSFICHIIEQPYSSAFRRPSSTRGMLFGNTPVNDLSDILPESRKKKFKILPF